VAAALPRPIPDAHRDLSINSPCTGNIMRNDAEQIKKIVDFAGIKPE
jgi:hypothetical protein